MFLFSTITCAFNGTTIRLYLIFSKDVEITEAMENHLLEKAFYDMYQIREKNEI